jgi:hypothetical protein
LPVALRNVAGAHSRNHDALVAVGGDSLSDCEGHGVDDHRAGLRGWCGMVSGLIDRAKQKSRAGIVELIVDCRTGL